MFCDLAGSTELSQRLDPEDLREINRAYQDASKTAVERYGGYVARYMGDGVLAYFGYPIAHEDDAERAVRAALGVIEAMDVLNARMGRAANVQLAVRIGIATGPVVVGDLIGEGASQESAAVGETPNLAARLQGLAERNSTVISPRTKQLAGRVFDYRDLGEHNLKGITEPVRVWLVTGESGVESRFEAIRGTQLSPLVGRDEELGLLLSRWRRATDGEGQLVLLSGEPGIGKSRITEALLEHVAEDPHTNLRFYCSPHHTESALHPVIKQLEHAAGFARDEPARKKLDKLEALLGHGGVRAPEAVSLLAALLSVPVDDRYPSLELTPQAQKARTFETLIEHIEHLAEAQPVLMVVEDAHWLDPTTIELLGAVINRVEELPALILVTFRPEFNPPWTGFATPVTSLSLCRLGRNQGWQIVEQITRGKRLPAEVLEQIVLKTDGVPLFVEELTKAILESDILEDAGDRYELAAALPSQLIPSTLHDSLMYRLDRQASVKEIALIASVIGREFSFKLLAAVTSLADDALERALDQLVGSELVYQQGDPPEATYSFKHALVQDAAYQSLLKSKKRRLHARIAEVLQKRFPETIETVPELLAGHFTAAHMAEEAIPHWLAAGQRAISASSLPEAVSHLSKALELTAKVDNATERGERELEVRTALGAATMALHGWPSLALKEVVEPACNLIERGHGGSAAFMNFWNLWVHHACRAEHREGLEVVDRMLKHASEQNDPVLTLISSFTAAMANLWVGNYDLAQYYESTALEVYQFDRDKNLVSSYNHDPRCTLLSWSSHRVWSQGYPDKARALSDEAVAHARRTGHPFNVCWTLGNSSGAYAYCGAYEKARSRIEELRHIAHEQALSFMEVYMAPVMLNYAAAQAGEYEVAYEKGAQAEQVWQSVGGRFLSSMVRAQMAHACLYLGRSDEALDLIDGAINLIQATGELMLAEEIYRIAGLVKLEVAEDHDAAERLFNASLEYSRNHRTKSFELRTAMSLARLWLDQGKRAEARDLLGPIYGWFTEGFDTADLKKARALLHRLS